MKTTGATAEIFLTAFKVLPKSEDFIYRPSKRNLQVKTQNLAETATSLHTQNPQ
jgi:hypothetical protein